MNIWSGRRAEAALVAVPGPVALHRPHARAHHGAVGEDDLHPALRLLIDAVGHVAHPVVERVADHAPPAEIGDRDAQLVPAGLDRLVQVEPAHARLHDRVAQLLVDLQHPVHVAQRHDHRAAHARRGPAVAVVAALPVGPQRHALLVGDREDRLDLLDRLGHEDGRRGVVVGALVLERITPLAEGLRRRDHLVRAECRGEGVDGAGQRGAHEYVSPHLMTWQTRTSSDNCERDAT